jgi:hypothetical protein
LQAASKSKDKHLEKRIKPMVELYNKIEAYAQEAHLNQQESKCDSLTKALSQLNLNSFEAVFLHNMFV